MSEIDGGRDFITKFSSYTAKEYAEAVNKKNTDEATKRANKLIKYVEDCYERKIKQALNRDKNCHGVGISLPYFQRVSNEDIQDKVRTLVEDHFRRLGFSTSLYQGRHCKCVFDIICNHGTFHIRLNW